MLKKFIYYKLIFAIGDVFAKTNLAFYYREIKRLRILSSHEIIEWQNSQLKLLVRQAYYHTAYYKALFDNIGLHPNDIITKEDLKKLPILSKDTIIKNFDKFIPDNINKIPHIVAHTGGSTGLPLTFLLDKRSWSFCTANTLINRENCGWNIGDKHVVLGSSSLNISSQLTKKHKIYYFLKGKISLSGNSLTDEVCKKYIEIIKTKKIRHIYGYASAIYLLADFVLRNKIKISLNGCFTTSEKLTDLFRQTIKLAFHCKILDEYGANDGGITAFNYGNGLFFVGYNSIFNESHEKQFSLLLTDLTNHAFPLLNYEIGDIVGTPGEETSNDYNGQVFINLLGRTSEIIHLENGSNVSGPGFTVLFDSMPVDYYCLKKEGPNYIKCYIKKGNSYSQKHEDILIKNIKNQIGDAKLDIEYSDTIFYTKSGKRAYFIN
ncbi:MAG: hypothetical protein PF484_00410 [Bacteroidales bacterium]|jgi:phenylacetate-CoA ligase|nr:hypothetical protein [Bacteroidales bacterium]